MRSRIWLMNLTPSMRFVVWFGEATYICIIYKGGLLSKLQSWDHTFVLVCTLVVGKHADDEIGIKTYFCTDEL